MPPEQKKKKINPHCPVAGCKTDKPHADDPLVKTMILEFSPPEKMTLWARTAMAELTYSICRDLTEKKIFAWFSRLRQPEELYFRTLYALFIASEKELHHIISGDLPNSVSLLYDDVNKVVFDGKGQLKVSQPGLTHGTFKPIETLHDGAHASFRAFLTCIGLTRSPQDMPDPERYREHLAKYCKYLDYMHGMFNAGKEKKHVLEGIKSLHGHKSQTKVAP